MMNTLHTKSILLVSIAIAIFALGVFAMPGTSHALSTSWNETVDKELAYFWDNGGRGDEYSGWIKGLSYPNITISYYADVKNVITGATYSSGASIPIGTKLSFTPHALNDTDIYWFGTGHSTDSPYGHWEPNAGVPPESDGVNACNNADRIPDDDVGLIFFAESIYIPLSINPPPAPTIQHNGTAGLQSTGGDNYTVTSPGTINSNFIYTATTGKFYYRYINVNIIDVRLPGNCTYNNTPLHNASIFSEIYYFGILINWNATPTTPFTLTVPQQTINFTATVPAPANGAPTPPTIGGDTVGNMDISYPFTFVSTDPENNALRYGIDWNNDSSVDQWMPGAGYTPSGTTESESRTWTTLGPRTFQVLAQDSLGNSSTWSAHTIDIRAVCDDDIDNDGDGDTDLADAGCDDPTGGSEDDPLPLPQCSDTLDNDGDTKIDYGTNSWNDPGCTSSLDNDETDPVPPSPNISISASPHFVKKGGTTDLSWNATNVTECSVDGPGVSVTQTDGDPPDLLDGEISDSTVTGVINSESLYTLSCTGQDASDSKAQVTVRVVPTFEEF